MAITTIGGTINSTAVTSNLDYKYGPYSSKQEAYNTLGPSGLDKLAIGLTVGILEDGVITEYWFKEGTTLSDLVKKSEGLSAYEIAVQDGYEGTEEEWLASLNGESAYQIAVENGYTGTEQEWLASLKANFGSFKTLEYNASGPQITASADTTQDIYLMPNAASDPTGQVMWITVDNGENANPRYEWRNLGETDIATFASGEEVNETYIDSTNLKNSNDNSIAKAIDVQELRTKLLELNIQEEKCSFELLDTGYLNGDNGQVSGTGYSNYTAKIDVENAKYVRFNGLVYPPSQTISDLGYAFGYYNNGTWIPIIFSRFDRDSSILERQSKEYYLQVPHGATHLLTYNTGRIDYEFYCYLISSDIKEELGIETLFQKTRNINYEKINVPLTQDIVLSNKYVKGDTGQILGLNDYSVFVVELGDCDFIEFASCLLKYGASGDSGYAFGHYENQNWIPDEYSIYDKNTESTNSAISLKIYSLKKPENSTHFAFGYNTTLYTLDAFFFNKIYVKEDVVLGTTSSGNPVLKLNLNSNDNAEVIYQKTLNDVAFDNKSYRRIFEELARAHYTFEQSFGTEGLEVYPNQASSNDPVREATTVDVGNYSLHCNANQSGISSCLRQTNKFLESGESYYIACRIYQKSSDLSHYAKIIAESVLVLDQNTVNTEFETNSTIYTAGGSNNQRLYFGCMNGSQEAYLDELVVIPLNIFSVTPTKDELDVLYNDYITIKKQGYIEGSKQIVPQKLINPLLENFGFTNVECMQEFMVQMNRKAAKIGMSNSTFSNPYGGDKYGYNLTTVEDMMKMMIHATSYPILMDYASQNNQVSFPIYGPRSRTEHCPTSEYAWLNNLKNAYYTIHSTYDMPYTVLARKGAGWGDLNDKNATTKVKGNVGTAIVNGHNVAYCVFAANDYYPEGTYFPGIVRLLDICKEYYEGHDISQMDVTGFNYAMACELPLSNPECYKNGLYMTEIYKKSVVVSDEEVRFNTASASKVLSTMVILDTLKDLQQILDINSYDAETTYSSEDIAAGYTGIFWPLNDSGDFKGYAGDKFSLESALYGILPYSNGVFTVSAARHAGAKMLYNKYLQGVIQQ